MPPPTGPTTARRRPDARTFLSQPETIRIVMRSLGRAKVETCEAIAYIYTLYNISGNLVQALVSDEISETTHEELIFRENSNRVRVLSALSKMITRHYLLKVVKRVYDILPPGDADSVLTDKQERTVKLSKKIMTLLLKLTSLLPRRFAYVMKQITVSVDKRFPGLGTAASIRFFFLRVVCPALTMPHLYLDGKAYRTFSSKVPNDSPAAKSTDTLSANSSRKFIELAKLLHTVANLYVVQEVDVRPNQQSEDDSDSEGHEKSNFSAQETAHSAAVLDGSREVIKKLSESIASRQGKHQFILLPEAKMKRNVVKNVCVVQEVLSQHQPPRDELSDEEYETALTLEAVMYRMGRKAGGKPGENMMTSTASSNSRTSQHQGATGVDVIDETEDGVTCDEFDQDDMDGVAAIPDDGDEADSLGTASAVDQSELTDISEMSEGGDAASPRDDSESENVLGSVAEDEDGDKKKKKKKKGLFGKLKKDSKDDKEGDNYRSTKTLSGSGATSRPGVRRQGSRARPRRRVAGGSFL
eukprot:TRINITY_DN6269_c0_g1_i1.p1 TRINITY_DN6269_c0_g1~~TRINITY_DN6269_c0_g1_i1.p1  ORF type:complete len:528 (-),score=112.09 TRINITY_DN6269_c0_g1_i1:356-1939(-)